MQQLCCEHTCMHNRIFLYTLPLQGPVEKARLVKAGITIFTITQLNDLNAVAGNMQSRCMSQSVYFSFHCQLFTHMSLINSVASQIPFQELPHCKGCTQGIMDLWLTCPYLNFIPVIVRMCISDVKVIIIQNSSHADSVSQLAQFSYYHYYLI